MDQQEEININTENQKEEYNQIKEGQDQQKDNEIRKIQTKQTLNEEDEEEKEEGDAQDKLVVNHEVEQKTADELLQEIEQKIRAKQYKGRWTIYDKFSLIELYDDFDKNHWLNQKFIPIEKFKGPLTKKRKSTDKFWILAFIILFALFIVDISYVQYHGNLQRLLHGMDFRQEICGTKSLKSRPQLYFLTPLIDINVAMCVESCPSSTGQIICLYQVNKTNYDSKYEHLCYTQLETIPLGRYCLPKEPLNKAAVDQHLSTILNYIKRLAADLYLTFEFIIIGLVLSIFLSVGCLNLLKKPNYVKNVVWGSIIGTTISLIVLSVMSYSEYKATLKFRCLFGKEKHGCGGFRANLFLFGSITFLVFVLIYGIITVLIFNLINLGIALLRTSVKTTILITELKYIPYILCICGAVIGFFIFAVILKVFSMGNVVSIPAKQIDGDQVKILLQDKFYLKNVIPFLFNIIFFLFYISCILNIHDFITAYSICSWYFTKKKQSLRVPIFRIVLSTLKHHMGTIIKASIVLPLFCLQRSLLQQEIIIKFLRRRKQTIRCIRKIQCILLVYIYAYYNYFRFLSKKTFIHTVMWGDNFNLGCKRQYYLHLRNQEKLRDLDYLQEFILKQVKICIAFLSCLIVYFLTSFLNKSFIYQYEMKYVEMPFIPTILVFIFAYCFAEIFIGQLDIISKSILQCWLMDEEMFIADQRYIQQFVQDMVDLFRPEGKDKKNVIHAAKRPEEYGFFVKENKENPHLILAQQKIEEDQKKIDLIQKYLQPSSSSSRNESEESNIFEQGGHKFNYQQDDPAQNLQKNLPIHMQNVFLKNTKPEEEIKEVEQYDYKQAKFDPFGFQEDANFQPELALLNEQPKIIQKDTGVPQQKQNPITSQIIVKETKNQDKQFQDIKIQNTKLIKKPEVSINKIDSSKLLRTPKKTPLGSKQLSPQQSQLSSKRSSFSELKGSKIQFGKDKNKKQDNILDNSNNSSIQQSQSDLESMSKQ